MVSIKFYFRGGTLFKIGTKVRGRRKRNIFWEKSKDYRKFARKFKLNVLHIQYFFHNLIKFKKHLLGSILNPKTAENFSGSLLLTLSYL